VSDADLVLVGRIARPHGLRGDVAINPETDFPEDRFAPGARLLLTRRDARPAQDVALEEMQVAAVRFHNGRPIVRFDGFDSIDAVESLGGASLWIRADSRPPLPDGHYYHDALIGCDVETVAGQAVGQVTRVDAFGSAPLLVVTDGRHDVLIPLAEAICVRIDPAARRIVIDPPEGLLDVNVSSRRSGRT
jgi:16S rRNA processing protein RimM